MSTTSFEPAPLTTTRQKYLASLGLNSIAQRLADIEDQWLWYKVQDTNMWREPRYTSMMRTDAYLARRLGQAHEAKYVVFGDLIGSTGTMLHFRFHADKTVLSSLVHRQQQRLIRKIRKVISLHLAPSLNKIAGYSDSSHRYNRTVKVLFAGIVDAGMLMAIQSALPPEVSVTRHIFPKIDYFLQLRAWANADLPLDEKDRADLELLIQGIHLTRYYGISPEMKRKFAVDSKNHTANLRKYESLDAIQEAVTVAQATKRRVPRSPKTGEYALFVSCVVDFGTRAEDILPEEWMSLPRVN